MKKLLVSTILAMSLTANVNASVPELGATIESSNGSYYQTYTYDDYIIRIDKNGKIMEIDLITPSYTYANNTIGDIYHPIEIPKSDYTYHNIRYVTTEDNQHNLIRVEVNSDGIVTGIVLIDKSLNY